MISQPLNSPILVLVPDESLLHVDPGPGPSAFAVRDWTSGMRKELARRVSTRGPSQRGNHLHLRQSLLHSGIVEYPVSRLKTVLTVPMVWVPLLPTCRSVSSNEQGTQNIEASFESKGLSENKS